MASACTSSSLNAFISPVRASSRDGAARMMRIASSMPPKSLRNPARMCSRSSQLAQLVLETPRHHLLAEVEEVAAQVVQVEARRLADAAALAGHQGGEVDVEVDLQAACA